MLPFLWIWAILVAATALEASGDAIVRIGLFERVGAARIAVLFGGGVLLFGYGVMLNLTPLPFERVVGLYIATLFVMWQVISFVAFRTIPNLPIVIGGALVVIGGLIITFWKAPPAG